MSEPSAESLERALPVVMQALEYGGEGFDVSDIIAATNLVATLLDTIREEERERAAKIADAYRHKPPAKIKRNVMWDDETHMAAVDSIRSEERGEKIAAHEIAKFIRRGALRALCASD